jgi:hypothetical protein
MSICNDDNIHIISFLYQSLGLDQCVRTTTRTVVFEYTIDCYSTFPTDAFPPPNGWATPAAVSRGKARAFSVSIIFSSFSQN